MKQDHPKCSPASGMTSKTEIRNDQWQKTKQNQPGAVGNTATMKIQNDVRWPNTLTKTYL